MVQPVIHPDDVDLFRAAAAGLDVRAPVFGGATRQASVRAGLEALSAGRPDVVLVHDAARPFASAALIARGIAAARASGAAIPALAVADTVKTVDAAGVVTGTIERAQLRLVQTPQAFAFAPLLEAHQRARAAGREDFTDDAALAEWAGIKVATFAGEAANVKLTTAEDFARVAAAELAALSDVRTGFGYDVHAFGPGDHVTLGGVRIAHQQGLSGHSDADVVLHALVDAILGALADGDIGVHFPPSDPQWRGAPSERFLAFAIERLRARQRPHRPSRRQRGLRGTAHRSPSRRHAPAHRADRGRGREPRGGEGDDQREARIHRAQRRHGGVRDRDRAVAVE